MKIESDDKRVPYRLARSRSSVFPQHTARQHYTTTLTNPPPFRYRISSIFPQDDVPLYASARELDSPEHRRHLNALTSQGKSAANTTMI